MLSTIILISAGFLLGNQQARAKLEETGKKTLKHTWNMINQSMTKKQNETTYTEDNSANGNEPIAEEPPKRTYY